MYAQTIYAFINDLQKRGFELILIIGPPGTGKSSGMRTLPKGTNLWFNADNKNPVWEGGRQEYGKKTSPTKFQYVPETYSDIIKHIDMLLEKGVFTEDRYCFLTGHAETFKEGDLTRVRLKTLGNLTNKMQIEGKLETVLYSKVEMESEDPEYLLETQNNGYNTARSPQGLLEGKISNDYNLILEKLESY